MPIFYDALPFQITMVEEAVSAFSLILLAERIKEDHKVDVVLLEDDVMQITVSFVSADALAEYDLLRARSRKMWSMLAS